MPPDSCVQAPTQPYKCSPHATHTRTHTHTSLTCPHTITTRSRPCLLQCLAISRTPETLASLWTGRGWLGRRRCRRALPWASAMVGGVTLSAAQYALSASSSYPPHAGARAALPPTALPLSATTPLTSSTPCPAAAVMEHGAGGLGAVKRALPSAEYGHIKLVAALINCRALWFSEGGAGAGEGGSAGSGSQGPSQQAQAQQAQHEQQQQQQAAGGPPPQAQQARQRMGSRQQGLSQRQQGTSLRQLGLAPRQLKQMRQACGSATAPAAEEALQQAKRAKLASPAAEVGQDRECASSGQAPAVEEAGVLESPAAGLAAPAAACGASAALKPLSRETLLRAIAESVPAGVSAVELQQRFGATGVPQGRWVLLQGVWAG